VDVSNAPDPQAALVKAIEKKDIKMPWCGWLQTAL